MTDEEMQKIAEAIEARMASRFAGLVQAHLGDALANAQRIANAGALEAQQMEHEAKSTLWRQNFAAACYIERLKLGGPPYAQPIGHFGGYFGTAPTALSSAEIATLAVADADALLAALAPFEDAESNLGEAR